MYTLTNTTSIKRDSDGAMIPADPKNCDFQEYLAWVAGGGVANPIPSPTLAEMAAGKLRALDEARTLRADILARLNGLHVDAIYANDLPPVIAAIMVAKQALKDITVYSTVVAATDYGTTKTAILARYYAIAATLGVSAPTAVSAFVGLDA